MTLFPLEASASAAAYIASACFLGALAVAAFLLPQSEAAALRRQLRYAAFFLLGAFLVIALGALIVQGAKLRGGSLPTADILMRYTLRTQSGRVWLARELYGALLFLLMAALKSRADSAGASRVCFFLALPLVAGRSLMSHAAAVTENTLAVVASDAVHLVATALWAGALPALFWTLWRGRSRLGLPIAWAARTVAGFSRLALFSVALLVSTGLYQSWVHVGNMNALFETAYGKVLLLKMVLFACMAGLGAMNFLSTRPKLARAASLGTEEPMDYTKALRRIGSESVLGLLVFCVTGVLTALPPAAHSRHRAPTAAGRVREEKKLRPAEGARIEILSPREGEVFAGDEIPLRFKLVKGKRGEHVHAYVDGELMGMFKSAKGTLTAIQPGRHTLELRVVTADHQGELDAVDRVVFFVE